MPLIHIKIDPKGIQRMADFIFEPMARNTTKAGDVSIAIEGRDVQRDWIDGHEDPGVNVGQSEVLNDLITVGVTLALGEDGKLTVVEE